METIVPGEVATHAQTRPNAFSPSHRISSFSVLLTLITTAAALFRFHALANRGLWIDEAFSVNISQNTAWELFRIVGLREIDMALYYVLLHFWMVLGDSEFVIRSMSVVLSVLTVPFTYALGSRLFGRNTGLIAAGLLALNAFHIRYAQEARAYALVVLLATVATWLLVRNLQQSQNASWTWYGVSLALTVYSHLLGGMLIVVTHYVALSLLSPRTIPWRGLARATVWVTCLTLPMAVIFPITMMKSNLMSWVHKPDWAAVQHFWVLASGNRGLPLLTLDGVMVAVLIFISLRTWLREGRSFEDWPVVLVLLWSFLPLIITLVVSELLPLFVPRYLLPSLPGFLLAVSAGLTCIRPRSVAWTLGSAIFILSLGGIPSAYDLRNVVDDWRTITSGIFNQAEPADEVSLYPDYSRIPFEYYRSHQKPVPEWPITLAVDTGAQMHQIRPSNLEQLEGGAHLPTHRLWVVFFHASPLSTPERKDLGENLGSWRGKGWNLLQVQEFPNVIVLLFATSSTEVVPAWELPNLFQFQPTAVSQ